MERIEPTTIASTVLAAPAWVRLGLAVSDERMRESAADALAARIVAAVSPADEPDHRQLLLPITIRR